MNGVFRSKVKKISGHLCLWCLIVSMVNPSILVAYSEFEANSKIQRLLDKSVAKSKGVEFGLLLLHSDNLDIHWNLSSGEGVVDDSRFHIASIGKIFSSTLIGQLVDEGTLTYTTHISSLLPDSLLDDLFVFKGQDYRDEIQIHHLLNHSSGVADWFDDKPKHGPGFLELAMESPGQEKTHDEALAFVQNNLQAVAAPDEKFHYSDTGYLLLGKIIEEITGLTLEENLHQRIFDPLGMDESQLLFYSEPVDSNATPMLPVWMGDVEITSHKWFKADWAGGGIVSSTEDLLLFMQALTKHELVDETTLESWWDMEKFGYGMDYGYGILALRFNKFSPFYSDELNVWGNWGSTATFMFYNPKYNLYLIGTFNQSKYIRKVVPFLMKVMRIVDRMEK